MTNLLVRFDCAYCERVFVDVERLAVVNHLAFDHGSPVRDAAEIRERPCVRSGCSGVVGADARCSAHRHENLPAVVDAGLDSGMYGSVLSP